MPQGPNSLALDPLQSHSLQLSPKRNPWPREPGDLEAHNLISMRRYDLQATFPIRLHLAAIQDHTGITGINGQIV